MADEEIRGLREEDERPVLRRRGQRPAWPFWCLAASWFSFGLILIVSGYSAQPGSFGVIWPILLGVWFWCGVAAAAGGAVLVYHRYVMFGLVCVVGGLAGPALYWLALYVLSRIG
jgi:hypothetical protein